MSEHNSDRGSDRGGRGRGGGGGTDVQAPPSAVDFKKAVGMTCVLTHKQDPLDPLNGAAVYFKNIHSVTPMAEDVYRDATGEDDESSIQTRNSVRQVFVGEKSWERVYCGIKKGAGNNVESVPSYISSDEF